MSAIEYNNLLFEISQRLEELNVLDRLMFMSRGNLASGSEDNIRNVLSLFKELEEQNNLGIDRLEEMKELLKGVREWSLLGKVKMFVSKRKEYNDLLEQIICALDELDDLERLIAMCRGKISEESEGRIQDVRSLFKELENQNNLGTHRLDILKGILTEMEKNDLVKEVEEFVERRNQEDEFKRKEDEFERRKAQVAAVVSSIGNKMIGVLNIKTVFKVVAGGITVVSTLEVLSRWSTFDQLVTAVNGCVLPAGTSLVQLTDGCVCLTVRAETLSALTALWKLYKDGTLETRLYDFFVTEEVRERAGGEEVEVKVTIEEQEYEKACCELINEAQEAASSSDGERIRRNSDSAVYFGPKEDLSLLKLKHAETELKFHQERIAVIEREIASQLSPEFLEACGPEQKATFLKQHERWKAREAGEMDGRTDESEIFRLTKAKSMAPEKYAFVQKYLEDVQDTRSITTEASDSGLATHAAASELGNEEISETNKLRMKDLSKDVTQELIQRLGADKAAREKFYRFFGLKIQDQYPLINDIEQLFPDTTVSVLKECFEALQLYDLAELLEKVRPRSLRPALSPEQIENLREEDDRPLKYHSNVAVLVVNNSVVKDIAVRNNAEKIEAFFKDLNSRNEVAIIPSSGSQEMDELCELHEDLWKIKQKIREMEYLDWQDAEVKRRQLEGLQRHRERLEKKHGIQIEEGDGQKVELLSDIDYFAYGQVLGLSEIKQKELRLKHELDSLKNVKDVVAKLREQEETNIEKVKKLKRETQKAVSTAMDKWIHKQEKFTCVAVFVISDDYNKETKSMLDKCVVKKLALLPDHAKLVVGPSWWKSIGKVPETLYVKYPADERNTPSIFTWMIEIFNKRWQTLDVISMMQEFKRTSQTKAGTYVDYYYRKSRSITFQDNLSTRLMFQKTEEDSSVKSDI